MLPSALYAICDADACRRSGWSLTDFAAACLDGGARFLQLRAKLATAAWYLDAATEIVRRAEPYHALIILNDRADLARLSGAGGVHVGQEDLGPRAVRGIVGEDALVGLSTHTPEQCRAALVEPIGYAAIGPVFRTATKETGYDEVGLDAVRLAAATTATRDLPLVAIGGITLERVGAVIGAGARSVAVITDLLATGDPSARVRQFLRALGEYD